MARALAIIAVLTASGLFAWAVPLVRLFDAFQPAVTALSIMVAAVFVRLNRGMPTLEWKSILPEARSQLTSRLVAVSAEYGWIIGINAVTLLGVISLMVIGKTEIFVYWPEWAHRTTAGVVGGLGMLCIVRMTYVVWRDIDVVSLQKRLIDEAAAREIEEARARQAKEADEKVTSIRAAGIRRVDTPPPKAWGE